MIVKLDHSEFATVLAALRFYLDHEQGEPDNRTDDVHDLATYDDAISLDQSGVANLLDRLQSRSEVDSAVNALLADVQEVSFQYANADPDSIGEEIEALEDAAARVKKELAT